MADKHDTVGLDLVAYCVNDIICQGANLSFPRLYGSGQALSPAGSSGCRRIPGAAGGRLRLNWWRDCRDARFYPEDEYDLAGFAVGVVERSQIIDGSKVEVGIRSSVLALPEFSPAVILWCAMFFSAGKLGA